MPEKVSTSTRTVGDTPVTGRDPVTDKRGVDAMRSYLAYIRDQTRKRYDADLTARDALASNYIMGGSILQLRGARALIISYTRLTQQVSRCSPSESQSTHAHSHLQPKARIK